jgi:hypothetical protein
MKYYSFILILDIIKQPYCPRIFQKFIPMKKLLSIILLMMICYSHAMSQQRKTETPKIERHKWDVGLDLLWLIDKNVVPPSLFLRLNTEKKGQLAAYRFRIGGDYTERLNVVDSLSTTMLQTNLNTFLCVGKEWQKQWEQFQLFYGTDIFLNFGYAIVENARDEKGYFPRIRTTSLGVSPLIGMRYFVHSNISFSTEAHFNFYYREEYRRVVDRNNPQPSPEGHTYSIVNRFQHFKMDINPIYTLNLTYHF